MEGIVKQTPGGDDISRAIVWQLHKELYMVDSDTEGYLERVQLEPEASPAVSSSSDDYIHSTKELFSYSGSEHDSDVHMHIEDNHNATHAFSLNGDEDIDHEDDDEEEDKEGEQDEEEEDEQNEDEDEQEDVDKDAGKAPRMLGLGETVNSSDGDVYTM